MTLHSLPDITNFPSIGFGLGSIFKISNKKISAQSLKFFNAIGCTALEINCYTVKELDYVLSLPLEQRARFEHFSLHAPYWEINYSNDSKTKMVLETIRTAHEKLQFELICIHPDKVDSWDIFDEYPELPIAIENMDGKKVNGQTVEELESIRKDHQQIVLDLQHCFLLDNSMQLAKEMIASFAQHIGEIHISGASHDGLHIPLFKTRQNEILVEEAVGLGVPFIIESVLTDIEDAQTELRHISSLIDDMRLQLDF